MLCFKDKASDTVDNGDVCTKVIYIASLFVFTDQPFGLCF